MSECAIYNFMHKLSIFLRNKLRVLRHKLSMPIKTLTPHRLSFSLVFLPTTSSSLLIISDAAIFQSYPTTRHPHPHSLSASQPHN